MHLYSPTLTYAMQTQELSEPQEKKINSFSQKCMRQIIDETWYTKKHQEKTYQSAYPIHLRTMQPTITSWMNKQSTIAMTKQTAPSRQIHLRAQNRMQKHTAKLGKHGKKQPKKYTKKYMYNTRKNTTKTPWVLHFKNSYTEKLKTLLTKMNSPQNSITYKKLTYALSQT